MYNNEKEIITRSAEIQPGVSGRINAATMSQRPLTANDVQHGGDHYKKYGNLQPWDVITAWNLGYLEGTALKYIARWRDKNGIEDLNKAIHFLQKAVEVYAPKRT